MNRADQTPQVRPKGLLGAMLLLLALQFVLGMYTNLFVTLVRVGHGVMRTGAGRFMRTGGSMGIGEMLSSGLSPLFMVHMMLGILLALLALIVALVSLFREGTGCKVLAWTSFLAVLVSGYSGMRFFMYGQHNGDSLIMALGWLIAFSAYFMAMST